MGVFIAKILRVHMETYIYRTGKHYDTVSYGWILFACLFLNRVIHIYSDCATYAMAINDWLTRRALACGESPNNSEGHCEADVNVLNKKNTHILLKY